MQLHISIQPNEIRNSPIGHTPMTLESLIAEANSIGWAVALIQHPDLGCRWECRLSRPVEQTVNGIAREVRFATATTPYAALDHALDQPDHTETFRPTGAVPAMSVMELLNIKPTTTSLPTITRR